MTWVDDVSCFLGICRLLFSSLHTSSSFLIWIDQSKNSAHNQIRDGRWTKRNNTAIKPCKLCAFIIHFSTVLVYQLKQTYGMFWRYCNRKIISDETDLSMYNKKAVNIETSSLSLVSSRIGMLSNWQNDFRNDWLKFLIDGTIDEIFWPTSILSNDKLVINALIFWKKLSWN